MSTTLLLAVQVAVASGCHSPVEVESAADLAVPILSISDGVHGGQAHFFFLPPLVSAPEYDGTFDGSRSPLVQICALGETSCSPVLAEFTTDSVPGSEWVRVDSAAEHYIVNWHTNEFALESGGFYRIRVLLGGLEAGHADIKVVPSGSQLKNAVTDEVIPLLDGRTLPIKFRIEEGLRLGQQVPAVAPDTVPAGFFDAVNQRMGSACVSGSIIRGIAVVRFVEGATQAEKQEAIDLIGGEVVGGRGMPHSEGFYYVRVEDDEHGQILCDAIELLNSLPQVGVALESLSIQLFHRRPDDGGDWATDKWQVDPASVESSARWGLEAIGAPLAWGCEVGSEATAVAVVWGSSRMLQI